MALNLYEKHQLSKHKERMKKMFSSMCNELLAEFLDEIKEETPSATQCPDCGGDTYVIDSRTRKEGSVRRVKECSSCKTRFATIEFFDHVVPDNPLRKK